MPDTTAPITPRELMAELSVPDHDQDAFLTFTRITYDDIDAPLTAEDAAVIREVVGDWNATPNV